VQPKFPFVINFACFCYFLPFLISIFTREFSSFFLLLYICNKIITWFFCHLHWFSLIHFNLLVWDLRSFFFFPLIFFSEVKFFLFLDWSWFQMWKRIMTFNVGFYLPFLVFFVCTCWCRSCHFKCWIGKFEGKENQRRKRLDSLCLCDRRKNDSGRTRS